MGKIARITNDSKLLIKGEVIENGGVTPRLTNNGDLYIDDIVEVDNNHLTLPTTGRINIPYNPTLKVNNTFSMSMWVNFTTNRGWKSLLTQGSWSRSWTFWQTSGIICLSLNGSHYNAGTATIKTNTWNHIAVTYNDGIAKYYQDGVLINTLNIVTGFSSGTQSLTFNDSSYPINGSVKDIRIIDRVITDSEVQNIYNNSDYVTGNEILWLPLSEGGGNIANDISGNGNNGAITNGEWESEPVNIKLKDGVLYASELIEGGVVYLAQDDDFVKVSNKWVYRGSELEIEIPHVIQGEEITSYDYMFNGSGSYLATPVTRVDSNNKMVTNMYLVFASSGATTLDLSSFDTSNVTNMSLMFRGSSATTLNLSRFNTSQVTNMSNMFRDSKATTLDLSSFDTSNVTNMSLMFASSSATILDLSSFDTSNVTNMSHMFSTSNATTLDLSSFDTSKVTDMNNMFFGSKATTGYARTQADADRFNNSSNKPSGLVFVVK